MVFATRVILFATLGVAALASVGCGDIELRSHPLGEGVVVDGNYDDWKGKLEFVEEADVSVGAQNDGTHLYVILVIGDRETQRKIMLSGTYLWFDAAGGTDRQFGVHFPMGMQNAAGMMMPRDRGGADPEELRERFAKDGLDEAELIAANGALRVTRSLANLPGVDIRTGNDRGAMVYEYRIPLTADVDSPYGIGAPAGSVIGVGLVTPEIDMSDMREKMGEGGRAGPPGGGGKGGGGRGGMGGGRGGMGGGRDGMRGGMGDPPEMPDPIDVWAKLTLAEIESNDD